MLLMSFLFIAMRRANERDTQSRAFSHLVIEGLETERRRISRELHDTVLPLVKDAQVSALIRSICMELMPPDFERLSLNELLAEQCAKFSKRTRIECACIIEAGLSFTSYSPENQLQLFRIIQEAFTNIEKHSQAGKASLIARRAEENILIFVSDDGAGIHSLPSLTTGTGLGIRSMRQRADILGAKLDFISESSNGFMVRILLPPPPFFNKKKLKNKVQGAKIDRKTAPFYSRRPPCYAKRACFLFYKNRTLAGSRYSLDISRSKRIIVKCSSGYSVTRHST